MLQKLCNTCKNVKPYSEFPTQKSTKSGIGSQCKSCVSARNKNRYHDKKEEILAKSRQWYAAHPEKIREYAKAAYRKNKALRTAITRSYQAGKLQRTPKWLTKEQKQEIYTYYKEARQKTEQTGVIHVVDHIVPLQGKTVSGLHVPENLQVIPASDNCRKYNKY